MPVNLTARQLEVLATLTALREATLPELREHFAALAPSALRRVLHALHGKQLVRSSGDESRVYVGGVVFWATVVPRGADRELEVIAAELREADVPFDHWIDSDRGSVTVLIPITTWLCGAVGHDSEGLIRLRAALAGLGDLDQWGSARMDTAVTADREHQDAFALELFPNDRRHFPRDP